MIFMLAPLAAAFAQDVLGKWKLEDGSAIVEVYQEGEAYNGRIVWLQNPTEADGSPAVDENNPDAKLRSRQLIGLNIIDFLFGICGQPHHAKSKFFSHNPISISTLTTSGICKFFLQLLRFQHKQVYQHPEQRVVTLFQAAANISKMLTYYLRKILGSAGAPNNTNIPVRCRVRYMQTIARTIYSLPLQKQFDF